MYKLYVKKVEEFFGVTKTREVYQKAVEKLPDSQAKDMCLAWAMIERRLGEIDRARGLMGHASQFCDPRTSAGFWKNWHDFEVAHGNEETFREMLRVKRSVAARYSQVNYMAAEMMTENANSSVSDADAMSRLQGEATVLGGDDDQGADQQANIKNDSNAEMDMEALERQAARIAEQVKGSANPDEISLDENPDEISLDDNPDEISLDDEEDASGGIQLAFKAVPDAVFGSIKEVAEKEREAQAKNKRPREEEEDEETMGALERLKKKQRDLEKKQKHSGWR
jgi:pre-mRNA-splicing factor SYF1